MKFSKRLFFRSALSLVLAVCILSGGLMLMGMAETEGEAVDTDSYAPDVSGLLPEEESIITDTTVPTPQEQLSGKFGQYSLVSEADGKSVVSIYSEEQINDFVTRRENGEWFTLSAEDMLFIIDDTLKLFSQYDVINVTGLDGVTASYPGISFYSSEEYKNCFGGLEVGTNEYSFNVEKDIWNVILARVEVLNSAVYGRHGVKTVFADMTTPLDETELWVLAKDVQYFFREEIPGENQWTIDESFSRLSKYSTGAFVFSGQIHINYIESLDCGDRSASVQLYPDGLIPENLNNVKYDTEGKTVVIEVWDMNAEELVARLRLEGDTDAKEVADLEALWEEFKIYLNSEDYRHVSGEEFTNAVSDYRVAVFFMGMEGLHGTNRVSALRFGADSYQDNCQTHFGGGFDEISEPCQLSGSQAISEYVNAILKDRLTQD
ncbi:MAG: hypothetical protein IKT37_02590 [Clostridia bacterium]|nr:hypothetical protein [Clostridia bacterium]